MDVPCSYKRIRNIVANFYTPDNDFEHTESIQRKSEVKLKVSKWKIYILL